MNAFESWLGERFGRAVTRDGVLVNSFLKKLPSGDKVKLTTLKPAFIYIPYRYVSVGLARIEDIVEIVGQYAIVVENCYAVANVPTMFTIRPDSQKRVKIGEEDYMEFSFDANSVVVENLNLFQNSSLIYYIFNEFIAKGNVPIYFNDVDFLRCLDLAPDFANLRIASNNVSLEMIVSAITRNAKDLTEYYRTNVDGNYSFIALRNIQLGTTNSLSKIMGSYYELALTSALARESDKLEDIEELLRL